MKKKFWWLFLVSAVNLLLIALPPGRADASIPVPVSISPDSAVVGLSAAVTPGRDALLADAPAVAYTLSMPNPQTHYFEVDMRLTNLAALPGYKKTGYIDIKMPSGPPAPTSFVNTPKTLKALLRILIN